MSIQRRDFLKAALGGSLAAAAGAQPGLAAAKDHALPPEALGILYGSNLCNVPKFEWDNPFPQIRKCELCQHLLVEDRYAACCESCPTEASLVGNPIADPEKPLEVLRTIHSFDPCLACAIHLQDQDHQEIVKVKVL